MRVTKLEPVTKTKYKVYLDEQFAFVLYKGELSRYKIQEETEISWATVDEIKKDILVKRVKRRALYLLNHMDRTEQQLRTKLKNDLYSEDMIDIAMDYVKSFGYVEDYGYAKRYVESKRISKSKEEIKVRLLQKGLSRDVMEMIMEESCSEQDDMMAIKNILTKKRYEDSSATEQEKRKMCGYLLRRGFKHEDIRQVIQVSLWNA